MGEFGTDTNITGINLPHNWDENGRIIEIAIYTNAEEIYGADHNSSTQVLMSLMHRRVELKGTLRERPDGIKSIAVQKFIMLREIAKDEK